MTTSRRHQTYATDDIIPFVSSTARIMVALELSYSMGKTFEEFKSVSVVVDKNDQEAVIPLLKVAGLLRQIDTDLLKDLQNVQIPAFENTQNFLNELIEAKLKNSQHSLIVKEPFNKVTRELHELKKMAKEILAESQRLTYERLEALKEIKPTNPESRKKIELLTQAINKNSTQYEILLKKMIEMPRALDTLRNAINSGLQSDIDRAKLQDGFAAKMLSIKS